MDYKENYFYFRDKLCDDQNDCATCPLSGMNCGKNCSEDIGDYKGAFRRLQYIACSNYFDCDSCPMDEFCNPTCPHDYLEDAMEDEPCEPTLETERELSCGLEPTLPRFFQYIACEGNLCTLNRFLEKGYIIQNYAGIGNKGEFLFELVYHPTQHEQNLEVENLPF